MDKNELIMIIAKSLLQKKFVTLKADFFALHKESNEVKSQDHS